MLVAIAFAAAAPAGAQEPPRVSADTLDLSEPLRRLLDVEQRLALNAGDSVNLQFERLGALYLLAVEDEDRIEQGEATIDTLRTRGIPPSAADRVVRLDGYAGAFEVLRAKHAFWPHRKLSHVSSGLSVLDAAVHASQDDAVIRYLRLMSGFYLPGIFGRGDEVRADFAALARLLPVSAAEFPGGMYATVIGFVLEHGAVDTERAAELAALLEQL